MIRICRKCGNEFEVRYKNQWYCDSDLKKIGSRSRRKGYTDEKRFEKWLQGEFERYGLNYTVHRTPRSGGIRNLENSDFMFKRLPEDSWIKKIHFEKKDRANFDIPGWIKDAEEKEKEFESNRNPVVIARKPNQTDEYAIMKSEFFIKLLLQLEVLTNQNK